MAECTKCLENINVDSQEILISPKALKEKIQISEILIEEISEIPSYRIHEVMNGENLSIIFEEFKVPLNTAYRIFRLDKNNLLSKIKPGDEMKFTYLGEDITGIEIIKDSINSILIEITDKISIKKILFPESCLQWIWP